ncbi:MAG: VOC family protein [Phycisphaerae bacterium]|nr:VOC family protein [Phycisphaerae bacterium]
MKIEHLALNVSDPTAMGAWYKAHLGMKIVLGLTEPPYTHFLADDGGTVMMELYHNTSALVPDYPNQDPLVFHLAFVSPDPAADKARLIGVGAAALKDETLADGSVLITVRDPWGIPVQLCKRAKPML